MLDAVPRKASSLVTAALSVIMLGACSADPAPRPIGATVERPSQAPEPAPSTTTAPPEWQVGATPLPLRPDGYGQVLPTPPELRDRKLSTVDQLPPPFDGRYASTV